MDKKDTYRIYSENHYSKTDTESHNKAAGRANRDRNYITETIQHLKGLKFPAYKANMIEFLRQNSAPEKSKSLVRILNDTRSYTGLYQVKKALEQNSPEAKQEFQITDETRRNLETRHVDSSHKRKDYTEVPATATKEYVCQLCGKTFQTRDDLVHHQEFEFKDTKSDRRAK